MRSFALLSSLIALSSCRDVATCDSVETVVADELGAQSSVAVHMTSGEDPKVGGFAHVELSLAELEGEPDCAFVAYRVDGVAEVDEVPGLDGDAEPVLPSDAELIGEGRLPAAGSHQRHVRLEAFLSGGEVGEHDPVDMSVVLATCSGAAISAELDLQLLLCQPGEHGPRLDPATSFRRLW